ncbi:MAG: UvrD-helicase domain-containing protein, partial [Elusimicrobiaceae bacterium]|nr:UvrD-helicase domain-containing protein [Elusimicrobiaceae bacterium]
MSHKEHLQALTLTGVNLVVEAGAGTGKTTLLINRLCLCVLAQNIPVEKLVALTFTDKAAAEIKTRFIFKLQQLIELLQAQQTNPPSAEEYETDKKYKTLRLLREKFGVCDADLLARSQCALARLDRACMGTIHSFCAEILKMFPLEAGLSPLAQIDTGQRAAQLFEQHWNRFLDVQLGVHAPQRARWKEVLSVLKLEDLKAFAQQLCALKPVEYNYYSHCDLLAKVCTQKSAQAQAWAQAHWPANNKPRAVESALMWAAQSLKGTAAFLKGDKLPPAPAEPCPLLGNAPKGWEADEFEQARKLIYFAQKITPEHQTLFLKAYELVQPIGQEMRVLYEQEGVLSFDDLIIKTRNLLQHNLYVRRILKEKFEMLFIDEFQDTDPLQGELLLFLAEEKAAAASRWQEVRLLPGKLIVVGDPKQSIYRFRGADITAYELFTDLILKQGGRKCFLQKNYRSTLEIVTLANEVCSRAMVQESAFQPAY